MPEEIKQTNLNAPAPEAAKPDELDRSSGIYDIPVGAQRDLMGDDFAEPEPPKPTPQPKSKPRYEPSGDTQFLGECEALGLEPDEVAEIVAREVFSRNVTRFLDQTPEFYKCESNAKAMDEYIQQNNVAPTVENLKAIYRELDRSGKIKPYPTIRSGLSDASSGPHPEPLSGDDLQQFTKELDSMPMDQARAALERLMRSRQR